MKRRFRGIPEEELKPMISHLAEIEIEERSEPVDILLVEDNAADVALMKEALKHAKVANSLSVAHDGSDALEFLHRSGRFKDAVRPDIIMLDLNLPGIDGREVLAQVKADPSLKMIPIVIVTTSRSDDDIEKSYSLHANSYVIKPVGVRQFFEAVDSIKQFWFKTARLPLR